MPLFFRSKVKVENLHARQSMFKKRLIKIFDTGLGCFNLDVTEVSFIPLQTVFCFFDGPGT
jgi:hypothetical protein